MPEIPDALDTELFSICAPEHIWVCGACGKTSKTKAPTIHAQQGWDASCMMNAVLCEKDKRPDEKGLIVWHAVKEDNPDAPEKP